MSLKEQSKQGSNKKSSDTQEKAKGFPTKRVPRLTPKGTGGSAGMGAGVSEARRTNDYQKVLNEEARKRVKETGGT